MAPTILIPLLLASLSAAAAKSPDISTCLIAAGVRNYTLPTNGSTAAAAAAASSFYKLLNFSLQNLHFAGPSFPKPAAIILPDSKESLKSTILCCRRAGFAVRLRSGGHSYEGLSYLANRGTPFAVVDLMNLNRVRVDVRSKTAWVEAGATLGEVYHAVAASSSGELGFPAGSCPTVGSGGHIAGGGFGLLSRKHGLAADNVLDAVLVDAEGRVLDGTSMGEDVFWAVRGGGGGTWGAVHSWKIKLVTVPSSVACFVINRAAGSARQVAELVDKWQRVAHSLPDEFYLSVFVGAGLPGATAPGLSATFKGFYLGAASTADSILSRAFPELGVQPSEWQAMSWIESVLFFSGLPAGSSVSDLKDRYLHPKTFFKAKSDYVRAHIAAGDLAASISLLEMEPRAYLILDPYGGAMGRVGSGHLPFPHRSGNLYTIQYLIEWDESEDRESERYVAWIRRLYDGMERFVSEGPRAAYVNYLDLDLGTTTETRGGRSDAVAAARAWGERYFLGNYERLVRAKTAIDPENVFSNMQSIPPLTLNLKGGACGRKGPMSNHSVI